MTRRTYETDGKRIEVADDLDELVSDKRAGWRANPAKARRRQRRYKKRLTKEILYVSQDIDSVTSYRAQAGVRCPSPPRHWQLQLLAYRHTALARQSLSPP